MSNPSQYLVTTDWLAQHLDRPQHEPQHEPQVVVVDCRFSLPEPTLGWQQYQAGHIPGAHYLDLNRDLSSSVQTHGGRHPLPDWGQFVKTLNRLGIQSSPPTRVVAYDDSRFAFAARLWWMLRYLGHDHVAILDGGIGAWRAAGLPLSQDLPTTTRSGPFTPQPRSDWLVDIDAVRHRSKTALLIDSRSAERFRGEAEPIDPIAGAVPGAVNAFWKEVTDDSGRLKSAAALAEHWRMIDDADSDADSDTDSDADNDTDEVMVYCGSGVTACVNLFSRVMAGKPMGKLYPGGWSDWCSYLV
ncbi:MAG: sulfurtransferase [Cyanobacteria bacterium P01_A01_bin.114]